jgi:hypothetical protein
MPNWQASLAKNIPGAKKKTRGLSLRLIQTD